MSALDAAKRRASQNFDKVKFGSPSALVALALKNFGDAANVDDHPAASDPAASYTNLLRHIANGPELSKDPQLLLNFQTASQKQQAAHIVMDKVVARLKDLDRQHAAQQQPESDPAMGSIQDRLRALRDAGMSVAADPAPPKRAAHNPKAASVSSAPPSSVPPSAASSSQHAFVPVSSLGPPSPSSTAYASSIRRHNLSSVSASSSNPAHPHNYAHAPDLRSEQDFAQSFPSIDELEAAFPSVPTSPPMAPPNGYSQQSTSAPSARSSRSQSVASSSRAPYITPSSSISPALEYSSSATSTKTSPVPSTSAAASAAALAVSNSASSRLAKPELPKSQSLSPKHIKQVLDSHLKVLIIDVRTRDESDRRRMRTDDPLVCIEPSILMRDIVTSQSIESALVVGPNEESIVFRNRDKFDNIIIYDEASDGPGVSLSPISRLIRAIYEEEYARRLKVAPYVLAGGLRAWEAEFGESAVVVNSLRGGTQSRASDVSRHGKVAASQTQLPDGQSRPIVSPITTNSGSSSPQVHTHDSFASAAHPLTPVIPTVNGSGPGEEPPQVDAYSHLPPETTGQSEGRSVPDSPVADTVRRLTRKPTISRPPSAGPMSAYRRPLHDIQLSPTASVASPIQYPSPIRAFSPPNPSQSSTSLASFTSTLTSDTTGPQAPAAASVSNSPLARRRSDYMEQSQMPSYAGGPSPPQPASTSRAAIDYPQLSVPHLIRPPPPAAAPLERQDQRPRITPLGATPSANGPPRPPLIASDYPVTSWSDMQVATSGLKNLGNTCYMNATIQCLSATIPFARFFTEGRWKGAVNLVNPLGTKGQLAGAFAQLLHEMWHGDLPYRSPYAFRKTVCSFAKQYANSDQHDSQEFLSVLLDGLHEDLNRVLTKHNVETTPEREAELEELPPQIAGEKEWQIYQQRNDSLIVDYFQGQFRNRVECLTCHKTSTTYNSFMYLSLPIPTNRSGKVTMKDCLEHFTRQEVIDKENAWNCPNCKCLRRATTRLTLSRLPPVLLIHFKRFSVKGPFTDKLETTVDFPIRGLDLTNYMPPPLPPGKTRPARPGAPLRADDPRIQAPPYKYDLYGVTNHYGTLTGGHYTAYVASRGGWLDCDDSRISEADPQSLTGRAYVLFYRRSM